MESLDPIEVCSGIDGESFGTDAFGIIFVVLASSILFDLFFLPVSVRATDGKTLAVQYVDTPVKFRSADSTRWEDLSGTTAELPKSGDFLVEEDGGVELKSEDARVNLNEKSGLSYRLSEDTADQIRLNHGSLKTEVESGEKEKEEKLQLETPMGSLGIRGTEFGVSFERSGRSEVFVDTGRVALRTDRDRTKVSENEYVAFGQRGVEPTERILDRGAIPDRFRITWNRWELNQRIRRLKQRRDQALEKIQELQNPSDTLPKKLQKIEDKLYEFRDRYQSLNDKYEAYRKRLEKKRGDFIRQRKQAFDEFRRRRMKEMRELERDREQGIEEMRRQREEALSQ